MPNEEFLVTTWPGASPVAASPATERIVSGDGDSEPTNIGSEKYLQHFGYKINVLNRRQDHGERSRR